MFFWPCGSWLVDRIGLGSKMGIPDAELVVTSWHCKFKGTSGHASNQAVKLWNKPLRSLSPGLHEHGTHVHPIVMIFSRGLRPSRVSLVTKRGLHLATYNPEPHVAPRKILVLRRISRHPKF